MQFNEAPIVFEMDLHCRDCVKRIRRSLWRMFEAGSVTATLHTGMVVVRGGAHLDPWTLKCFLVRFAETRHGGRRGQRGVATISDGGRPDRSHFVGIRHLGPRRQCAPPPPYYHYRGWYDDDDSGSGGWCTIM